MLSVFSKLTLWLLLSCVLSLSISFAQNSSGRLTGTVTDKDGKPFAGVTVVATNQTDSDSETERTRSDGSYSMRLSAGAYRITIDDPYEARFDRGKTGDYGVFSNVICDDTKKRCATLENVIIDGSDRKIDIVAVDPAKDADGAPADARTVTAERREVRDRVADQRSLS